VTYERGTVVSSAEAFLQAILADPDADGPRLVFADWLDEHGDHSRAEFIRTQIALARMREDDPRRQALAARERELIGALRDRWLREYAQRVGRPPAELRYDVFSFWVRKVGIDIPVEESDDPFSSSFRAYGPEEATFERGMFGWVRIYAGTFCQQMETLFRDWPVRHLCLTQAWGHESELAARSWPGRVAKFILSEAEFRRGELVRFLGSPNVANVRELTLKDASIDAEEVAGLVGLKMDPLESFSYVGNERGHRPEDNLGPGGAATLVEWPQMPRLKRLELRAHDIGSAGVEALCAPGRLGRLTHLGLAYNDIPAGGASTITRSEFFGALELLDLGGNALGDEGLAQLARGPHRGRLRSLRLVRSACGPAGIRELLRSTIFEALTELDLCYNPIGAEGAAALARTPALVRLQTLDLYCCGIGAEGTRALAASPYLGGLRSLDLGGNELGEAELRLLIESPYLTSLRSLDLGYNGLGDGAARALAHWPGLARLKYLGLSDTGLGDAGAEALAKSPYAAGVGTLELWHNARITEKGKAALAAAGLANVRME
jgi:uncharacterized protein (TIGR02996 family)